MTWLTFLGGAALFAAPLAAAGRLDPRSHKPQLRHCNSANGADDKTEAVPLRIENAAELSRDHPASIGKTQIVICRSQVEQQCKLST